jgi:hypothetical protein
MDENLRDTYNRFGAENLDFDPRKDELKLILDFMIVYLFWGIVAYISTLPSAARGGRTWIIICGIVIMVTEISFKLTESSLPEWFPRKLTEYELIYYLHSIFPTIVALLRALSEANYMDLDQTSVNAINEVCRHQKVIPLNCLSLSILPMPFFDQAVNQMLQEFELMLETTKKTITDSTEPVQLEIVKEKILTLRSELDSTDDRYTYIIDDLKSSTSSVGSSYYWVIFVVLYGGIYFFNS